MSSSTDVVLLELNRVFATSSLEGRQQLIEAIIESDRIVALGAGRVGLAMAAFAKRLSHLGKTAYWHGDATLPRLGVGDLMLVGSGSGETESIVCLADLARRQGLGIALITSNPQSTLLRMSQASVILNCPNKLTSDVGGGSVQPMTTLFEQSCSIFLDSLVLDLMLLMNVSEAAMQERHNAIE